MIYTIQDVKNVVGRFPYMEYVEAEAFDAIIKANNVKSILEIGTFHGVSTCYLGASVSQNGGNILTIDLFYNKNRTPHITSFIKELKADNISYIESVDGAQFEMLKMIKKNMLFDMIYIDGDHFFENALGMFCIADVLLKSKGVLVMDDIEWNTEKAIKNTKSYSEEIRKKYLSKSDERKQIKDVGEVWDNVIKRHPSYHDFNIIGKCKKGICLKK